ncbi:ATP dependent DNA ligase-like protein [Rhodococcus sp. SMB37]|nr:ATP dependent DNA ligase-like protein [Rhodococcus sp. SMB37]
MLATLGQLPAGDSWAWEMKWDGARAISQVRAGACRFYSRNGNDITVSYPELPDPLLAALDGRAAASTGRSSPWTRAGRPSPSYSAGCTYNR